MTASKIHVHTITMPTEKFSMAGDVKTVLIDTLDLEPVKYKLMKEEHWTLARVDRTEKLYKGFLKLILLCPDQVAVPSLDIDEMWHTHILDTRKYINDCVMIFGEYVHHYPYMGLKDDRDAAELKASFEKTKATYIGILGFDIFSGSAKADCGGGCGGGSSCSGGSSCGTGGASCGSHQEASCGTYIPSAICGSTPSEREEKKRERERKKKHEEPKKDKNKNSWWPKLRFDGAASLSTGFGRYDLSRQYRPGRAEVEAMGVETTLH